MRLYQLAMGVFFVALGLAIARETVGRVALVVFFTGLGEIVFGTIAMMALFQTVGSIGEANSPLAYAEAFAATAVVLMVATVMMNGLFWMGIWLLQIVVT